MGCAASDALGVLVRTEKADLAVGTPEGLQALEAGVGIVEHTRECAEMKLKILRCRERCPFTVPVVTYDYRVGLSVMESQV